MHAQESCNSVKVCDVSMNNSNLWVKWKTGKSVYWLPIAKN